MAWRMKNGPATKQIASTTAVVVKTTFDADRIEDAREQADATGEGCQQPDPGDRRGQHERDLDERDHERPTAESPPAEEVGRGRPEEHDHGERDRIRDAVSTRASRTMGSSSWSTSRCSGTRAKIATIGSIEQAEHEDRRAEDRDREERVAQAAHVTSSLSKRIPRQLGRT